MKVLNTYFSLFRTHHIYRHPQDRRQQEVYHFVEIVAEFFRCNAANTSA